MDLGKNKKLKKETKHLVKEMINMEEKLIEQFYLDHLTSLPNLYKLRSDLENTEEVTLVVLNIDSFKILNDFYGFIIGDFILESLANRLKIYFKNNNVYRIASDEFAVILDKKHSFYDLKEYLNIVQKDFTHIEFSYADTQIYIDLTFASSASKSTEKIFSKVNMALKYAKEEGLRFWIYEDNMSLGDEYESNLKYAVKIRNALNNSHLVPYFQPIIDNKTGKIVKYEALSRLIDEEGVVHSPDKFIPVAKKIKVYNLVTKMVIDKTFETFKDSDMEFAINLSFEDIINQDIYEYIINQLATNDVGQRVTFELLESEKVKDFKKVIRFFNEIKRYGGKVAIDDFGSGFSNFSYMINLKPDYIKIDGSLIKDIDTDKNAQIVVETIIDFTKKLGIQTVAEYVHSSTVLSKAKSLGIDYSQGFYIDQPKPTPL